MASASLPVANLACRLFPSTRPVTRLRVMSCSSPSNSLLFAQSLSKRQLWRRRKANFGAREIQLTENGDVATSSVVQGSGRRGIISSRKSSRDSLVLPIGNSLTQSRQLSVARMEIKSSPTDCGPETGLFTNTLNLPLNSRFTGHSVQQSSVSTNASGGKIVAEPSSARREAKKRDFVPDAKLAQLRELFGKRGINAYIVPSEDAHQSEFMADSYLRRAYISGFTGSAGSVVITMDKAALWTDGRYFLQAENQLGAEWTLMRAGTTGVPTMSEWIRDNLPVGSKVGIDPYLFTSDTSEELKRTLAERDHNLVLIYETNLVDQVWGSERPKLPGYPLRVHDIKFAGVDVTTKLTDLRRELITAGATAIVVTMLDDVAWLLNLRGNDVPHSPVTYAYVLVELESATLFVDESKVTSEVAEHLAKAGVIIKPYDQLISDIKLLAPKGSKLWLDSSRVSVAINDAFNDACVQYYSGLSSTTTEGKVDGPAERIDGERNSQKANGPAAIFRLSPISLAKALKNVAELEGMKQAHLRDAAALAEFWAWLEKVIIDEKQTLTEVEVADNLDGFRAKQAGFLDTSFDTISGSGPNGAIVHYRAQPETCGHVDDQKLFLLDSGAQYIDGTTDITRTVHFGAPTHREKECFTRVLQGHIAVDSAVFPENTPGFVLDVLARSSLWKIGLDYRHGTGHGVGAALNVHEGPQGISSRFGNITGLQAGMIVSNEPGYYEDRAFGIRIENLVIIREVQTANRFGGVTFLGFERLTFVPIQIKMLDFTLLSEDEINWVNEYHAEVWDKVSPLVVGDAREWLHMNTRPISPMPGPRRSEELANAPIQREL